jgi:head-tail adaptor
MPDAAYEIGRLRHPVTIAARGQAAADGGGISESLTNLASVWADIQPVGALTFYSGVQVDTPITHKVRLRWMDWLDTTHVLIRELRRPDGTVRRETYRIRRVKEDGASALRWIDLECELEKRE